MHPHNPPSSHFPLPPQIFQHQTDTGIMVMAQHFLQYCYTTHLRLLIFIHLQSHSFEEGGVGIVEIVTLCLALLQAVKILISDSHKEWNQILDTRFLSAWHQDQS
ncbi:unnamed protein product [Orchesella dallaii]|uniref:Uncharacterized protein n=1 Tax=Orchesella dallaii TaxID=48710 RepID=A0ABP1QXR1_9HEXA